MPRIGVGDIVVIMKQLALRDRARRPLSTPWISRTRLWAALILAGTGGAVGVVSGLPTSRRLATVLVLVAAAALGVALWRGIRWARPVSWALCAALLAVSFPLHLLFEIPAGLAGEPTDWPAIRWRLVMLLTAAAIGTLLLPRVSPHHPDRPTFTPLPRWAQRAAYAGFFVPLLGWTVPHLAWFLGYPIGLSEATLAGAQALPTAVQLAVTLAPTAAGLLTLGLARRWGQVFPAWLPVVGRRRVPALMAVVPAAIASYCLVLYGVLGLGIVVSGLTTGAITLGYLIESWVVTLTEVVFVIWGVSVAVAMVGYAKVTWSGVKVDG